jgi:hypothetical protein
MKGETAYVTKGKLRAAVYGRLNLRLTEEWQF